VHLGSDAVSELSLCPHTVPVREADELFFGFLSTGAQREQRSKVKTTGKCDAGTTDLSKGRELPKFLTIFDGLAPALRRAKLNRVYKQGD